MTGEPIMLTMEQKQERSSELQTLLPIFDAVEKCIPYLKTILKTTPRPNPLYKSAITPFGRLRLSALELLYRLVCSRVPAIDAAIAKEDILSVCMDLFFRYSNNTFLHVTVTKIVYEILRLKEPRTKPVASVDHREVYESEYRPVPELTPADVKVGATDTCAEGKEVDDAVAQEATVALYRSLFNECGICNRLLKAVDESAKRKDGHRRPTYMSHVYQLANMIERSLRGETHALTTKESILRKIRTGEPKKDTEEAQAPDNTNNASTGVFVPKEWVRFVGDELMVDNASLALPLGGKRPTDPLSHFGDSDEDMNAMEDDAAQLGLHRILAQQLAEEPEDFDSNINFDDENNAVLNRLEAVAAATKSQNENHNSAESEFTSDYFSSALQSAFDDPVDEGLSSGSNRSSVDENADPWKDAFDMLKDEVHKAANGDNDDPMGEGNEAVTDEWDAFEAAAPPNATKDDVGGVFKAATANENDDMWGAFETADDDKSDKPGTANRQLDTTVTGSGDDEDGWADFKGASS
ncbi:hypothetical protein SARC_00231 [Sphaeroforma arctica JP610]|uniref:Uncharacterized protein n=1 Tax=Sphaeroforma arctica JP610 TaxID=667725 RepID=A0A0L0GF44_9EUKA|nr:hypothetical protein SARC_00231 [Sphaeroforma arctica JP610]KNC87660.1 hypothetical protein SARC_00231 [Sphaeroforma arctica JP610]|eukprot:XP_014161562.1 hypothetical protein SARC_00231 [Sphaeroforma arctica JP610]